MCIPSRAINNIARISYLELLFSLRIPASTLYVVAAPVVLLIILGNHYSDTGFILTGITALTAGLSTLQGVGQVAAGMRHGTWKTIQVVLHPEWQYLAGVVISRVARTVVICVALLLAAKITFGYSVHGSVIIHLVIVLLGSFACASVGMCLAYAPASPMAASTLLNMSMLLMMIISGIFVPASGWLRSISYLSPLSSLVNLLRSNANGDRITTHYVIEVVVIMAWIVASSALALWLGQRREDD